MIKIVLDTNVLMSELFWSGAPASLLLAIASGHFKLLASEEIINEYNAIFERMGKKFGVTDDQKTLFRLIIQAAHLISSSTEAVPLCRDKNDQMFLDVGVSGDASYIISGDKDLLDMEWFPGGRILTPKAFIGRYKIRIR